MAFDFQLFLNSTYWNNTGADYLIATVVFLAAFVLMKIFKTYVLRLIGKVAKKSKSHVDDAIVGFAQAIPWLFFVIVSIFIASRFLVLPGNVGNGIWYVFIISLVYYGAKGTQHALTTILTEIAEGRENGDKKQDASMLRLFGVLIKIAIWVIALMLVLTNLGIDITPLLAGVGVGGIAIAFALQNVLGDLFSSFSIFFDKPFKKGDFLVIGDDMGTVKDIGLKSTRLEALQGQELIISNQELTSTRINNYKKMRNRRISFGIGVEYGTKPAKLKKIPDMIKKIITKVKLADFDRTHFKNFGDFSLNFEIVYYVKTNDYAKYMDTQQEINLAITEAFEKEKIEMAFPTQTVHVKK